VDGGDDGGDSSGEEDRVMDEFGENLFPGRRRIEESSLAASDVVVFGSILAFSLVGDPIVTAEQYD
jgi:hypothetical protein